MLRPDKLLASAHGRLCERWAFLGVPMTLRQEGRGCRLLEGKAWQLSGVPYLFTGGCASCLGIGRWQGRKQLPSTNFAFPLCLSAGGCPAPPPDARLHSLCVISQCPGNCPPHSSIDRLHSLALMHRCRENWPAHPLASKVALPACLLLTFSPSSRAALPRSHTLVATGLMRS